MGLYLFFTLCELSGGFKIKLDQCINFRLTKLQQSVRQLFLEGLVPFGVTEGQCAVLHCLWDKDGQSPEQISEQIKIDSSLLTDVLERMEQKALIERRIAPNDKTVLQAVITDKGRQLEKPILQMIQDTNQRALASLKEDDTELLRLLLNKANK